MALSRRLFATSLVFSAIAGAADPTLLNLVMPNARVVVGIHLERIMASPIGQQMDAQIRNSNPEIRQIFEGTGFDPARDLKEVVIAATGREKNGPSLVLVRGSLDLAKIAAFSSTQGVPPTNYEGVPVMMQRGAQDSAFALMDNSIAIFGGIESVHQAIRRRASGAAFDGELAAKVAALSRRYDAWVISTVPLTEMASRAKASNLQQVSDLVNSIQEISGGMRFSPDMEIAADLVTHSEKDAASVRDAMRFFASMLSNQQNNPGLKADALKVTLDARTVRISLHITEEQLKKMNELQMARRARQPVAPRPANSDVVIQSSEGDMGTVTLPPKKD
ncbi:MAG TPA: hypothetical protein VE263_10865 [Candidatus Angelobacter sp.]|nr:hypothetical protein [Candidatus Angelobacter sp.]